MPDSSLGTLHAEDHGQVRDTVDRCAAYQLDRHGEALTPAV